MTERVAGLNGDSTVTDVFVVEDFKEWASGRAAVIAARWPGGLVPLDVGSPVAPGWTLGPKGWKPPAPEPA